MKKKTKAKDETEPTRGTAISLKFCKFPDGRIVYGPVWAQKLARRIDAAIRRAVKDAWWTATNTGTYSKEEIEAMYGVKL